MLWMSGCWMCVGFGRIVLHHLRAPAQPDRLVAERGERNLPFGARDFDDVAPHPAREIPVSGTERARLEPEMHDHHVLDFGRGGKILRKASHIGERPQNEVDHVERMAREVEKESPAGILGLEPPGRIVHVGLHVVRRRVREPHARDEANFPRLGRARAPCGSNRARVGSRRRKGGRRSRERRRPFPRTPHDFAPSAFRRTRASSRRRPSARKPGAHRAAWRCRRHRPRDVR